MVFQELRVGDTAQIAGYVATDPIVDRLKAFGLVQGTKIKVTRIAPLGDPFEVLVRGYKLGLRRSEGNLLLLDSA